MNLGTGSRYPCASIQGGNRGRCASAFLVTQIRAIIAEVIQHRPRERIHEHVEQTATFHVPPIMKGIDRLLSYSLCHRPKRKYGKCVRLHLSCTSTSSPSRKQSRTNSQLRVRLFFRSASTCTSWTRTSREVPSSEVAQW